MSKPLPWSRKFSVIISSVLILSLPFFIFLPETIILIFVSLVESHRSHRFSWLISIPFFKKNSSCLAYFKSCPLDYLFCLPFDLLCCRCSLLHLCLFTEIFSSSIIVWFFLRTSLLNCSFSS